MSEPRFETELVRALLREQHPDLAELELREVAGGWDNQMWQLGTELAVRLPRTERGPDLLRSEQRWVPELAARLPLPTPDLVRVGEPSARFGHTWSVVRWVPGDPADRAPITRADSADVLAGFLAALHTEPPRDAPQSRTRGIPLVGLDAELTRSLALVTDPVLAAAARATWAEGLAAPPGTARTWLHADLHPANVVVRGGALAGVLDFGDLCAGDPATDLSAAWVLLPAGAAERFFDRYPATDAATRARARAWAVLRSLHLLSIGRNGRLGLLGGKPTWEAAGRAALERAVAGRTPSDRGGPTPRADRAPG